MKPIIIALIFMVVLTTNYWILRIAIGINDVGEVGAKNLAFHFKSIDRLIGASFEELTAIRDVGVSTAKNIISFFASKHNIEIINKLKSCGLIFNVEEKELSSNKLEGLTFVISGTFDVERDELKKIIEENGGKNVGSLSKSTSYLIVGDNMGPAKKEKAIKDNVKMISEYEFYDLIK
jgi:DNA ligase (NAD+)